ncbi:translation elongation factor Ts [Candidatus Phytoplasma oryzae]|nr:translation elongation factor Ts [Candidatus Phytoplasma oryzae]
MIKTLRRRTQAGIVDCKKALIKTQGDIDKAIILINKERKSLNNFLHKDQIFSEGLVNVAFKKNRGILFELNTQTDFVSNSQFFLDFCHKLENILLNVDDSVITLDDFLNYNVNQQKIKDMISEKSSILGETINLRRIKIIYKKNEESFGIYKHIGNKIVCLVRLTNPCIEVEKNLPIHIVCFNPKFISKDCVESSFIEQTKQKILKKIKLKNPKINEKWINISINKKIDSVLNEICLLEQFLYNNPKQKITEYLKLNNTDIIEFHRFELCEND